MPSRRKRKREAPTNPQYQAASAIDTTTEVGRVQLWHQRLQRAKDMLHIDARDQTQKDTWKLIDGSYALGARDKVYLNEAWPNFDDLIDTTVPAIPDTRIEANQMGQEGLARSYESLVDATLDSDLIEAHDSIVAAEWDETGWGIGFLKMAWRSEEHPSAPADTQEEEFLGPHVADALEEHADPDAAKVATNDEHSIHLELHLDEIQRRVMANPEDPTIAVLQRHAEEHQPHVGTLRMAYPIMSRIDPKRMLYDPDADRWRDVTWIAELCDDRVTDLQIIPGIKRRNLNPKNCPPLDEFGNQVDAKKLTSEFDFQNTRVQVWKIHDRDAGELFIMPADVGEDTKPLLEVDWPYGACDTYQPLIHHPVPGRIHGFALRTMVAALIEELARVNNAIRKHVRRAAAYKKIVASSAGLSRKETSDLESEDLSIAEVNEDALQNMQDWVPPAVPPQLIQYRLTLLDEMRRLMGHDILTTGGETKHQITAHEAGIRASYESKRMKRRQDEVSRALCWTARNILMFFKMFASERIAVKVAGEAGFAIKYVDPQAIPEDLIVRLDIKSYADAEQGKTLTSALEFYKIVQPFIPMGVIPMELLVYIGRLCGIQNPETLMPELMAFAGQLPAGVPGSGLAGSSPDRLSAGGGSPNTAAQTAPQPGGQPNIPFRGAQRTA